jgi:peptidoglycan hydrolase FlgJ
MTSPMIPNNSPDTTLALTKMAQAGGADNTRKLLSARKLDQINEKAIEFEAMFIAEMMKPMFEGISTEAPFGGGKGEEIFRGMLMQEYGKSLAETGGIGIARSVKAELIRAQAQEQ